MAQLQLLATIPMVMDEPGAIGLFAQFELAIGYRKEGVMLNQHARKSEAKRFRSPPCYRGILNREFRLHIPHRSPSSNYCEASAIKPHRQRLRSTPYHRS